MFRSTHASADAGPSRPPKTKKRSAQYTPDEPVAPPSKSARVASPTGTGDDFEYDDPQLGTDADPMAALESVGAAAPDPMEALEADAGGEDGEDAPIILPKRADEFEQEAEREVDNAKGLGEGQAEGKMKLVHQVRHQVSVVTTETLKGQGADGTGRCTP